MTDPLLNYQTPQTPARPAILQAAWISILVLGIIYCVGGTCLGVLLAVIYKQLASRVGNPRTLVYAIVTVVSILEVSGILYFISALHLRRGSRAAALFAAIVGIFDAAASLLVVGICLLNLLRHTPAAGSALGSMILYSILLLVNLSVVFLSFRARAQMRHEPPDDAPPLRETATPGRSTQ